MQAILYSILAAAIMAAGVVTQLVPPTFNNTPQANEDKEGALRLHNYYRGQVDVPGLSWCDNLTEEAQVAADWSAGANIPETPDNFTSRASENASYSLQVVYLSPGTPHLFGDFYQATLAFWADHTHYNGEVVPNGDFFKYSSYTQMVWNGTTCLGMAGATNRENGTFVFAAYSPPGNVYGQKPFNTKTASSSISAGT